MNQKCKTFLIILGLIIILVGIGVVIFIKISSMLANHGENCVIRHLHETGYLKNITMDRDPRETDLYRCKFALHHVKGEASKALSEKFGNCTINEDRAVMEELLNLSIFSRFLAKENKSDEGREVRERINDIIDKKCNGGF